MQHPTSSDNCGVDEQSYEYEFLFLICTKNYLNIPSSILFEPIQIFLKKIADLDPLKCLHKI